MMWLGVRCVQYEDRNGNKKIGRNNNNNHHFEVIVDGTLRKKSHRCVQNVNVVFIAVSDDSASPMHLNGVAASFLISNFNVAAHRCHLMCDGLSVRLYVCTCDDCAACPPCKLFWIFYELKLLFECHHCNAFVEELICVFIFQNGTEAEHSIEDA